MRLPQPTKFMEKKLLNAMIISHRLVFVWRNLNEGTRYILFDSGITLGARGFSCVVSGFVSLLKKWSARKAKSFSSRRRRSCLRPSAEHVSACGRRNEAPRRTREKSSGIQGIQVCYHLEIKLAKFLPWRGCILSLTGGSLFLSVFYLLRFLGLKEDACGSRFSMLFSRGREGEERGREWRGSTTRRKSGTC